MQTHSHCEGMPAELWEIIESMAESSKGAPWYAAYDRVRGLAEMTVAALS